MIETHKFALFLTASLLLAATPGPGMLYVLSRTLAGGKREGVLSSLGTFLGGMVHVFAAAAGLSVVLATSAMAFSVVKFAGAGYLIFLGLKLLLNAKRDLAGNSIPLAVPRGSPFWQGVVTEVLNPKTALFFLSFIPQFVSKHSGNAFAGFVSLGLISVVLNTCGDLVAVSLAAPLKQLFARSRTMQIRQRQASGAAMIVLGAYVAVSDSR
ncbi:MAG TPA: LysE family translocator [Candidatus Angelobacter sp.]|nr:LysE family translocator [Candidatus Angelobacter sp.]